MTEKITDVNFGKDHVPHSMRRVWNVVAEIDTEIVTALKSMREARDEDEISIPAENLEFESQQYDEDTVDLLRTSTEDTTAILRREYALEDAED